MRVYRSVGKRPVDRLETLDGQERKQREDVRAGQADVVERPPATAVSARNKVRAPKVQVPGQYDGMKVIVGRVQKQHVVSVVPEPGIFQNVAGDVSKDS